MTKKTKKVLVAAFIAAFGLAMANITLASAPIEEPVACTMEYQPVCGEVQVQCVTAPCYPVQQTFGNRCQANVAKAMNIQNGTCESQSQKLFYTNWKLASFNDTAVQGESTLSFRKDTLSAKVCNSKSGSFTTAANKLVVGPMMSTLMACAEPVGTYEAAFDLSGATYNILGSKLTINTVAGQRFVWNRTDVVPVATEATEERKYGYVGRQINQLIKAKNLTTYEQKRAYVATLIAKVDYIMSVAKYTPLGMYKITFLKNALQYYYDNIK